MNRKYLDKLIAMNDSKSWRRRDFFLSTIRPKLPEGLELVSPPPLDGNYNCFLFMLGLHEDKEILSSSKGFIYDGLIIKLIDESLLERVAESDSQNGDYVIYADSVRYPEVLTHGGILDENKVLSKWAWGPLLRHKALDVPDSYGSELSYFRQIEKSKAAELYWEYKSYNLPIEIDFGS
ncbi:MAG: hypothetical protein Q8Q32_00410 [bacterium]|nr:hypothetical protein [bacterium]